MKRILIITLLFICTISVYGQKTNASKLHETSSLKEFIATPDTWIAMKKSSVEDYLYKNNISYEEISFGSRRSNYLILKDKKIFLSLIQMRDKKNSKYVVVYTGESSKRIPLSYGDDFIILINNGKQEKLINSIKDIKYQIHFE